MRRIAHLDMDAFYASVELLRYPQLKGLPVVIGGGRRREDNAMLAALAGRGLHELELNEFPRLKTYTGRGVITTATYAARAFGVGSAMGLMKAAKLCPDAILLPVDFEEYRRYSRAFKAVIAKHCPVVENRGVDEVFIDFTGIVGGQYEGGRALAEQLQREILEATGLTCSVGVAPNRLLAKMASEFNKPNGISIVYETDIQSTIWPLAVRKINGIGPKAGEKLTLLGIKTIGQLAARNEATLIEHFGKSTGAWMSRAAWGLDDSELVTDSEPVSISRETTFERDMHAVRDKAELGAVFTRLCERLADDLLRKGYKGKTIGVKVKYEDFKTATRDHTINAAIDDAVSLRAAAGLALKRMPLEKRIRLLGVRVGSLSPNLLGQNLD
jgi:DNA polymerase IV